MIGLVLFDLDGTLVDSARDLCASTNVIRTRRGLPAMQPETIRDAVGAGIRGLMWAAMRLPSDAPSYKAIEREFLAHYEKHLTDHAALFPGISELLSALKAAGIRWGVVTNKLEYLARPVCEASGLLSDATCIVGGDTAGARKPDPTSILHAIGVSGFTPQDTIYVGDDPRDTQAAHNAGIACIAASWGYNITPERARAWGADFVALTPMDIKTMIGA